MYLRKLVFDMKPELSQNAFFLSCTLCRNCGGNWLRCLRIKYICKENTQIMSRLGSYYYHRFLGKKFGKFRQNIYDFLEIFLWDECSINQMRDRILFAWFMLVLRIALKEWENLNFQKMIPWFFDGTLHNSLSGLRSYQLVICPY